MNITLLYIQYSLLYLVACTVDTAYSIRLCKSKICVSKSRWGHGLARAPRARSSARPVASRLSSHEPSRGCVRVVYEKASREKRAVHEGPVGACARKPTDTDSNESRIVNTRCSVQ